MNRRRHSLTVLLLLTGCPGGGAKPGAIAGKGSHEVVASTQADGTVRLMNTDVVPGGSFPADQPAWSFALPAGWEHAPEGSGGLDVITDVTIRRELGGKKLKLKASLSRPAPDSARARAFAAAGSIERLVADPAQAGITGVLPKHAAGYTAVQVAGIPCMRGVKERGPSRGEQALGMKDGLWLEVEYALASDAAEGQAASKEAFERVLATLRLE